MRRSEWILGGIAGFLVVVIFALVLFYWLNNRPDEETDDINNLEYETAREAYDLARPVAEQWSSDAVLFSASAGWQPGVDFSNGRASWTLIFYSAAESANTLISVTNGKAQLVRTTPISQPLRPGDISLWQLDSPSAIEQLLKNGADDFVVRHARVNLILTLDLQTTPTWRSTFLDVETKENYNLNITADTGEFTP